MRPAVALRGAGVRFHVPRHGKRLANIPRLRPDPASIRWGLRDATIEIASGESVGVIGANGSGKSTLLRTISGIFRPDEGDIVVDGRVAPVLSASGGLRSTLTGRYNIHTSSVLHGLSRQEAVAATGDILAFAGLEEYADVAVRVYSAGMRARLGFAIALFSRPDILVLDEVMATGDQAFRKRSTAELDDFVASGRTLVTAGHEIERLMDTCDRLVHLDGGRIVQVGDPRAVGRAYLEEAVRQRCAARDAAPDRRSAETG